MIYSIIMVVCQRPSDLSLHGIFVELVRVRWSFAFENRAAQCRVRPGNPINIVEMSNFEFSSYPNNHNLVYFIAHP